MALDPSIYRLFAPRTVNDFQAESQNLENARTAGEANQLQLLMGRQKADEYTRGVQDQNALRELQRGMAGLSEDQIPDAYMKAGRVNEAMSARKAMLERQKEAAEAKRIAAQTGETEAKTVQTGVETAGKVAAQFRDRIAEVQTPEDYVRLLKAQYDHPILGPEMQRIGGDFMGAAQRVPSDPKAFPAFIKRVGIGMEKFAADETSRRGQDTTAATSLATNKATNDRQAADAAASRAVQMRGQNMTDARSRESNTAAVSKPFEVTGPDGLPLLVRQDKAGNITPVQGFGPKSGASKPLNDTQAKALLFGTRMQESDKVLNDLAKKGAEIPSLAKRVAESVPLVGGALAIGANAVSTPEQQQVEQAQRDFINAALRRESGAVIADSEFANARKQYFPEVGDAKSTKEQKARNRKLVIEGLLAEVPEGRRASITPKDEPKPAADADIDALLKKYAK